MYHKGWVLAARLFKIGKSKGFLNFASFSFHYDIPTYDIAVPLDII